MNRTEFFSFYKKEILPLLGKYESERKKLVNIYYRSFFYLGIDFFIILSVILLSPDAPLALRIFAPILICIGFYFVFKKLKKSFVNKTVADFLIKIKKESLNNILSKFGKLTWKVVAENSYKESISGCHNGVEFTIVENSENLTFEFTTNKLFKATTFVYSKYDTNTMGLVSSFLLLIICFVFLLFEHFTGKNSLSNGDLFEVIFACVVAIPVAIHSLFCYLKYRKTKLEDVSFNKGYIVRTEDEVEARYFLTTGFMERFKNLQTVFGKKNISCKCENNKIIFTIDKKGNPFEIVSVFKSFNNPEVMIKLYHEINAIFKMIDYFKLAEDTKI